MGQEIKPHLEPVSTSEHVRSLRLAAGLTVREVAARAGVSEEWYEQFEAGRIDEGPNYDVLLRMIAATEPPRPPWWDSGHEHDLHLPADAVRDRGRRPDYWAKIEKVRRANRGARSS